MENVLVTLNVITRYMQAIEFTDSKADTLARTLLVKCNLELEQRERRCSDWCVTGTGVSQLADQLGVKHPTVLHFILKVTGL